MFHSGDEGDDGDDDSTAASPTQSEAEVAEEGAGTTLQDDTAISHAPAVPPPPASLPANPPANPAVDNAGQTAHEASPPPEERNTD